MADLVNAGQDEHALVLQLRRRRVSMDEIARHLSVPRERAWEIYREAVAEIPVTQHAEYLAEEMMIADDAIRDLLAIARNHDPSARTAVEAWNAIRGWSEHKARIAGLGNAAQDKTNPQVSGLHAIRQARRA